MRRLPLLLLTLAGCAKPADSPHPSTAPRPPRFVVGSPAPPLNFGEWLHGDPLTGPEPGKPLVLDFWASWCGPCLQAAPHLQQVAEEFAGRATVVGVTVIDGRNPMPAVMQALAATKASRYAVRHATVPPATEEAYRVNAFPTAVVVGPDGRVAYVGNPMLVDEVLDRLLAGTWAGKVSAAEVDGIPGELGAAFGAASPAASLAKLAAFEAARPGTAGRPAYRVSKVSVLVAAGRFDEARAVTEQLLPPLAARKDVTHLGNLRAVWADPKANPTRVHADLAVRAAQAALGVEGADDPAGLAGLADAHLFAGDKEKGRAVLDRALAAAPDGSPVRKWLTDQRKRYE